MAALVPASLIGAMIVAPAMAFQPPKIDVGGGARTGLQLGQPSPSRPGFPDPAYTKSWKNQPVVKAPTAPDTSGSNNPPPPPPDVEGGGDFGHGDGSDARRRSSSIQNQFVGARFSNRIMGMGVPHGPMGMRFRLR
jgi:hypothetical protein